MAEVVVVSSGAGCRGGDGGAKEEQQVSLAELLLAALRKSMVACSVDESEDVVSAVQKKMEIGGPTDVRHIAHVTFDRFHGFLGLPVEFEVEIPGKVPSASASVFGVSPESMQCRYDSRGNSVPTILLLLQERLYSQGGLKAEGIFRINPENSREEYVRDKLNEGIVPDDIDVHCLAGLIKAWFRELPAGVLDGLSPEQVLRCKTEEEFVELIELLLPPQAALLSWAVELMADVVEEEEVNKMNARNIAMVFAPNMSQMSDPLTALMHAVQVMNFLKTLILKTLREREDDAAREEGAWSFSSSYSSSPTSSYEEDDDSGGLRGGGDGVGGEMMMEHEDAEDGAFDLVAGHNSVDDGEISESEHEDRSCNDDDSYGSGDDDGYGGEDETESEAAREDHTPLEWEEEEERGDQAAAANGTWSSHVECCVSMSESRQGWGCSSSLGSDGENPAQNMVVDVSANTGKKFETARDV